MFADGVGAGAGAGIGSGFSFAERVLCMFRALLLIARANMLTVLGVNIVDTLVDTLVLLKLGGIGGGGGIPVFAMFAAMFLAALTVCCVSLIFCTACEGCSCLFTGLSVVGGVVFSATVFSKLTL